MPIRIEDLVEAIQSDRYRVTDSAGEEANANHLPHDDVLAAVATGEIIEQRLSDYPPKPTSYRNLS